MNLAVCHWFECHARESFSNVSPFDFWQQTEAERLRQAFTRSLGFAGSACITGVRGENIPCIRDPVKWQDESFGQVP